MQKTGLHQMRSATNLRNRGLACATRRTKALSGIDFNFVYTTGESFEEVLRIRILFLGESPGLAGSYGIPLALQMSTGVKVCNNVVKHIALERTHHNDTSYTNRAEHIQFVGISK